MTKQHATLRPGANALLIVLWGGLATALFLTGKPYPVLLTSVGALLGLLGGIMQSLSIRQAQESFLDATTMLEVRSKLKATAWGKRYLFLQWSGDALLLVLAVRFSGNRPLAILAGFSTGVFTRMFIREIITLKPTFELSRLRKGDGTRTAQQA